MKANQPQYTPPLEFVAPSKSHKRKCRTCDNHTKVLLDADRTTKCLKSITENLEQKKDVSLSFEDQQRIITGDPTILHKLLLVREPEDLADAGSITTFSSLYEEWCKRWDALTSVNENATLVKRLTGKTNMQLQREQHNNNKDRTHR